MTERAKKKPEWLSGKLFLRPQEGAPSSWQHGRIDRRINKDHYLIVLYSWTDDSSCMSVASVASMTSWKLYDLNEGRDDWKREGERLMEAARRSAKETT